MEVLILARAIGSTWKTLWPRSRTNQERADVGVALSVENESKLLKAVRTIRSHDFETYVRLLLITAMRTDREALNMLWRQVDFDNEWVTVGKSKTAAGEGRIIPMNEELLALLKADADLHARRYGELDRDRYLFPRRKRAPADPTHHVGSFKKAWARECDLAGIDIRLYDCRHTVLTKLAESGARRHDHGDCSALVWRMLERFSPIRMKAKRAAKPCFLFLRGDEGADFRDQLIAAPLIPSASRPFFDGDPDNITPDLCRSVRARSAQPRPRCATLW